MSAPDVLCFSHLRWNFVFQRPNHLMTRCAREKRVFFIEEPMFGASAATLEQSETHGVTRAVPHLPEGLTESAQIAHMRALVEALCAEHDVVSPIHWHYTPMVLPFTRELPRVLTVYDCMDELSAFMNAPPALGAYERELMAQAEVMFTGGMALYEAKRAHHPNVHGIPSSVDVPFFATARSLREDPIDQALIPHPRIGYYGVIDERLDLTLLAHLADARPSWHIVMLGPVVKIDPSQLPRRANIHYLGRKTYDELPSYVAGWDVAMMPFALNESTRFISPTKTPEYLAAGRPVVSTAIRDVVEPYERLGLVRIGRDHDEFVRHVERALANEPVSSQVERDRFLSSCSWDATWQRMDSLISDALTSKSTPAASRRATQAAE